MGTRDDLLQTQRRDSKGRKAMKPVNRATRRKNAMGDKECVGLPTQKIPNTPKKLLLKAKDDETARLNTDGNL